jgi:hypothetical protein
MLRKIPLRHLRSLKDSVASHSSRLLLLKAAFTLDGNGAASSGLLSSGAQEHGRIELKNLISNNSEDTSAAIKDRQPKSTKANQNASNHRTSAAISTNNAEVCGR